MSKHKYIKRNIIDIKNLYKGNDCTIFTLSTALGISYDFARIILQRFDKTKDSLLQEKSRTKTEMSYTSNVIEINEVFFDKVSIEDITLQQFTEENNIGDFVVLIKGHTFVIHNGFVIDRQQNSMRINITHVYKVNKEKSDVIVKQLMTNLELTDEHINENFLSKELSREMTLSDVKKEELYLMNNKKWNPKTTGVDIKYFNKNFNLNKRRVKLIGINTRKRFPVIFQDIDEGYIIEAAYSTLNEMINI